MTRQLRNPEQGNYLHYAPALRRYFSRRVPNDIIDDLVNEVFLSLHARKSEIEIDNIEAYIFTVARNALTKIKDINNASKISIDHDNIVIMDRNPSLDRIVIGKDELKIAINCINRLPVKTRDIFVMHRFEDLTYKMIALKFGISVSAVEKHIMTALKALTATMRQEEP